MLFDGFPSAGFDVAIVFCTERVELHCRFVGMVRYTMNAVDSPGVSEPTVQVIRLDVAEQLGYDRDVLKLKPDGRGSVIVDEVTVTDPTFLTVICSGRFACVR